MTAKKTTYPYPHRLYQLDDRRAVCIDDGDHWSGWTFELVDGSWLKTSQMSDGVLERARQRRREGTGAGFTPIEVVEDVSLRTKQGKYLKKLHEERLAEQEAAREAARLREEEAKAEIEARKRYVEKNQLTVCRLIDLLKGQDPNQRVFTAGVDEYGYYTGDNEPAFRLATVKGGICLSGE